MIEKNTPFTENFLSFTAIAFYRLDKSINDLNEPLRAQGCMVIISEDYKANQPKFMTRDIFSNFREINGEYEK